MRRTMLIAACAVAASVGACAGTIPFVPAAYLRAPIENATGGRMVLTDAQGTVWRGSARVAFASGGRTEQVRSAAFPAPIDWQIAGVSLAPAAVSLRLSSDGVLDAPVLLAWSLSGARLAAGRLRMPADVLEAAGAPLNTLKPGGWVTMTWDTLNWRSTARADAASGAKQDAGGTVTLDWADARSALSPVAPLGTYRLQARAESGGVAIDLSTQSGPLLLSGTGRWTSTSGLQFRGEARPDAGRETELAPLLGLLGPVRNGAALLRIGT